MDIVKLKNLLKKGMSLDVLKNTGFLTESSQQEIISLLNSLSPKEIYEHTQNYPFIARYLENKSEDYWLELLSYSYSYGIYKKDKLSKKEAIICIKDSYVSFGLIRFDQDVETCILALEEEKKKTKNLNLLNFTMVKIVQNPDHETTLKNLYAKKSILDSF